MYAFGSTIDSWMNCSSGLPAVCASCGCLPAGFRPLVEVRLAHDDDGRPHHGVPEATELGADDREGPELVRRHRDLGRDARHSVLLLPELRNPERVDDVE